MKPICLFNAKYTILIISILIPFKLNPEVVLQIRESLHSGFHVCSNLQTAFVKLRVQWIYQDPTFLTSLQLFSSTLKAH